MRSRRFHLLLLFLLLLFARRLLLAQQSFRLQAVHIVGSKRFPEHDLVAASGLEVGSTVDLDALKQAADRLMQTGVLASLQYQYTPLSTGLQVEYTAADAPDFLPCRYDNIVWIGADELTKAVHDKVPLYDGSAPTSGDLIDQIASAISEVLAKSGIMTKVRYELHTRGIGGPVDAISFVSDTVKPKVQEITLLGANLLTPQEKAENTKRLIGDSYSATEIRESLTGGLFFLYGNKGYLRVQVGEPEAKVVGDPQQGIVAVTVPVTEGAQYRWHEIEWSGNSAIPTANLQRLAPVRAGSVVDHGAFDQEMDAIHTLYTSKGYLRIKLQRTPSFNDQDHTVAYAINIIEGDQFRMGALQIAGLDPGVVAELQKKWKMQPGEPYDEGYLASFLHDNSPLINGHGRSRTLKSIVAPTADKTVNVTLQF
ncbi:MAG TPA: POTRA domain-containing protein [Terriglobales bacterium]